MLLILFYKSNQLIKFVKWVSIYFTINYCLFFVVPAIIPPFYSHVSHVRTFFPTYISLAIFLYLIELKMSDEKSFKTYAIVVFLFLGLIFATHSALTIMTLFGAVLYLFVYNEDLKIKRDIIIKLTGIGIFASEYITHRKNHLQ